jgi:ketosteroid isomerase-like protein
MSDISTVLTEWTAAERTGDVTTVDRLLTDDFVGVGPLGFALPKPAWLGRLQGDDLHYDAFDLDEIQTREHGDVALVTARHTAKGDFQGNPIPEAVRVSIVLLHTTDAWQIAGMHMSFIAGTPGAPPIPGPPAPNRGDAR